MADSSFALTGVDDVLTRMRLLPARLQKRGLRRAGRKAINIVRDGARENAKAIDDRETAARIYKNIVSQESGKAGRREGGIVMKVGVRGGASMNQHKGAELDGLPGKNTTHWRFIELGTATEPPVPFMRNALSDNIDAVTDTFCTEINIEIDLALREI